MDIGALIGNLLTSSGPGGIIVLLTIGAAATIYFWLTRWILLGNQEDEDENVFR